jgi:hypothetical protein
MSHLFDCRHGNARPTSKYRKPGGLVNRTYLIVILSLLTTSVGGRESGDDLIVLQNGSRQTGKLQGCLNASCQLNGHAIPQAAIAWIGFSYAGGPPPAVKNPVTDEIHERSGSVESGRLVAISLSKVVTEKHSYDRAQVAWIHLAPPPGGAASRPGTTLFHYDVVVTGHAQSACTETGDVNGTTTTTVDWTTTFTNAAFKKLTSGDTFGVSHAVRGFIQGGTTDAKYTFDETARESVRGGLCHGTILLSALGTHLSLSGSRVNGRTEFRFNSQLDSSAGAQLHTTIHNQTADACRTIDKTLPEWTGDYTGDYTVAVVRGLKIGRFISLLEVRAERHDPPEGPLLSPLKEFAIGDAFSFTTGEVQRSFPCGRGASRCNVTAMTELKVNVTPHH